MAEKILNTRIRLKYDTLANWNASTFTLGVGEIAVATVPVGDASGASLSLPAVLAKVGDGVHKFSELPWMQAVASDVYGWAKAAEKPSYSASEISGLEAFIGQKIQDTNTTYQLVKVDEYNYKLQSKELGASTWTDVSTLSIPDKTADIAALKALVGETAVATQISDAIGALEADVVSAGEGEVLGSIKQVDGKIVATTKELTAADIPTIEQSQVNGLAAALADKQATLAFDGAYDATDNKVATQSTVTNAIAALDVDEVAAGTGEVIGSIKEVDGKVVVTKKTLAAADIPAIAMTQVTGLGDALAEKQATIAWQNDNYDAATNKAITKSDLDNAVAGLAGATHFVGVKDELPDTGKDGDICIIGTKEYIYSGSTWQLLGDETAYITKGTAFKNADIADDAAIAQSKIAGLTAALADKANASDLNDYQTTAAATADKQALEASIATKQNTLMFDGSYDASTNKAATVATVTNEINKLNVTDAAVEGQVVSAVNEVNGKIEVSRRALVEADIPTLAIAKVNGLQPALDAKANSADLAAVATSGSTDDLVVGTEVWVFNCGSATENIG